MPLVHFLASAHYNLLLCSRYTKRRLVAHLICTRQTHIDRLIRTLAASTFRPKSMKKRTSVFNTMLNTEHHLPNTDSEGSVGHGQTVISNASWIFLRHCYLLRWTSENGIKDDSLILHHIIQFVLFIALQSLILHSWYLWIKKKNGQHVQVLCEYIWVVENEGNL